MSDDRALAHLHRYGVVEISPADISPGEISPGEISPAEISPAASGDEPRTLGSAMPAGGSRRVRLKPLDEAIRSARAHWARIGGAGADDVDV